MSGDGEVSKGLIGELFCTSEKDSQSLNNCAEDHLKLAPAHVNKVDIVDVVDTGEEDEVHLEEKKGEDLHHSF